MSVLDTLSSSTSANIEIDSLYEGQDFYTSITRAKFEIFVMIYFEVVSTEKRLLLIPKLIKVTFMNCACWRFYTNSENSKDDG